MLNVTMDDFLKDNQLIEASCRICTAARTLKLAHSASKKISRYYKKYTRKSKFGKSSELTTDLKYITKLR